MLKTFEVLPHTADIKIRVYGATLADLFRNALIGMFQSIGPHADGCIVVNGLLECAELPCSHQVAITATTIESLLVDFLSRALYLSDVHNEAYLDAKIHEINETHVKATIFGVSVTRFEVVEIKAVTYHDLMVRRVGDGYQVDIVFDI
ncbi:archease [Candidatus Dependentiae bacterium]|nr:archease [Candidatus Dependentiae bacterium]